MYNENESFICNIDNEDKYKFMAALTLSRFHNIVYIKNEAYNDSGISNKSMFGVYTRDISIYNGPLWIKFDELKKGTNNV